MTEIKPIETCYNGYRFRSRAEARWAVFFDNAGIEYEYEPEGFQLSNGDWYLPDFYLQTCKTWFEVKGILSKKDDEKIRQLIKETKRPCVIGFSDLTFSACDCWFDGRYVLSEKSSSMICRCRSCGNFWFMGNNGFYGCECCGVYAGDSHFVLCSFGDRDWKSFNKQNRYLVYDDEKLIEDAFLSARGARFEHGERGNL